MRVNEEIDALEAHRRSLGAVPGDHPLIAGALAVIPLYVLGLLASYLRPG